MAAHGAQMAEHRVFDNRGDDIAVDVHRDLYARAVLGDLHAVGAMGTDAAKVLN
jgi:hypothetical protein